MWFSLLIRPVIHARDNWQLEQQEAEKGKKIKKQTRCGGEAIEWLARSHILIYQHIIIQSYYYVLSSIYHLPLSDNRVSLWDLSLTMNRSNLVVWHRERRTNKLIIYLIDVTRIWFRCFFFCFSSSVCLFQQQSAEQMLGWCGSEVNALLVGARIIGLVFVTCLREYLYRQPPSARCHLTVGLIFMRNRWTD